MFEEQQPQGTLMQREEFVFRMMDTDPAKLLPTIEESYKRTCAAFGVLCFAGDPRSVLMWSHYGANHTGVCLQFAPARDLAVFPRALSTHYLDEYPTINWVVNFKESIGATLLRKHSRWQYEDEYRVSIPDAAGKFIPFRPEALTGIILGCRADEAAEAAVRSLLEERAARHLPALRIYRARRNARRYDIDLMAAG